MCFFFCSVLTARMAMVLIARHVFARGFLYINSLGAHVGDVGQMMPDSTKRKQNKKSCRILQLFTSWITWLKALAYPLLSQREYMK